LPQAGFRMLQATARPGFSALKIGQSLKIKTVGCRIGHSSSQGKFADNSGTMKLKQTDHICSYRYHV
jgi:hypothetical protein